MRYVTIPGIDGSDHEHWQSIWEAEWGQQASRISVSSWSRPELEDWCDAIDRAVASGVAGRLATAWALPRVSAGPVGHINSASGLGRWDLGHALLTAFTAGLRADRAG
jgi:predicted alpha/beta hydrolase family esterase